MRRAALALVLGLISTGCVMQPVSTPSPSPSVTLQPTATVAPSVSASPIPTSTPPATPGLAQVPRFPAGAPVVTNAPGLRVRSRPGTEQRVITSLGVDADVLIGLGPVLIDGMGWYLVRDADADEPQFGEGWVSAGFEPDPFLIAASFSVEDNPYLAGFAHDASGEYGPVLLPGDRALRVRWIAAPLDADGCSFAVDFLPGSGEPVRAIRATVGTFPAPGDLFDQFFDAHPELIGELFVSVTSDCSWALTFAVEPIPSPTPSPT